MQIHVWDPIPHRAAPYDELFSWGTRHRCSTYVVENNITGTGSIFGATIIMVVHIWRQYIVCEGRLEQKILKR